MRKSLMRRIRINPLSLMRKNLMRRIWINPLGLMRKIFNAKNLMRKKCANAKKYFYPPHRPSRQEVQCPVYLTVFLPKTAPSTPYNAGISGWYRAHDFQPSGWDRGDGSHPSGWGRGDRPQAPYTWPRTARHGV